MQKGVRNFLISLQEEERESGDTSYQGTIELLIGDTNQLVMKSLWY